MHSRQSSPDSGSRAPATVAAGRLHSTARPIDIFIVGAQKAGTTSLLRYMSEHPEITGHPQLEMSYFYRDQEFAAGYETAFKTYYGQRSASAATRILGKNVMVCSNENAIARLREHNPNCRLIFMLRNPVERAYSSYLMQIFKGSETETFDDVVPEAIRSKQEGGVGNWRYRYYLGLGFYALQLETVFKYFDRDAVKVILVEEFHKNQEQNLQELYRWVGVAPTFVPDLSKKHNESSAVKSLKVARVLHALMSERSALKKLSKKIIPASQTYRLGLMLRGLNKKEQKQPPMSQEMRAFLTEFYEPHNRQLRDLLQIDLAAWK